MSAPKRIPRTSAPGRVAGGVACGGCGLACRTTAEWLRLELIEVLDSKCVQEVLSDWPPGLSIEIRRCRRCRGEIARAATA
jgi:hypothetical protein